MTNAAVVRRNEHQVQCRVLELRQYTLAPGARDTLVDLFDRQFIESQEALGISVIGQFRDLDRPDRFVWLRGFADMESRGRALAGFYDGRAWTAHREAANATMIAFDDVLLLRPWRAGFCLDSRDRPVGGLDRPARMVTALILTMPAGGETAFRQRFEGGIGPALASAGAPVIASFVTEPAPNNYPRLPIREGENVFVWFQSFADEAAHARYAADMVGHAIDWPEAQPKVLRLQPTARSLLR